MKLCMAMMIVLNDLRTTKLLKISDMYNFFIVKTYKINSSNRFMVANNGNVENKHFDKDSYDEAVAYQLANIATSTASYVNHSGGATGSDTYWSKYGERYGVISKHYYREGSKTPTGNTPISDNELKEADKHLTEANKTLGRRVPTRNE